MNENVDSFLGIEVILGLWISECRVGNYLYDILWVMVIYLYDIGLNWEIS